MHNRAGVSPPSHRLGVSLTAPRQRLRTVHWLPYAPTSTAAHRAQWQNLNPTQPILYEQNRKPQEESLGVVPRVSDICFWRRGTCPRQASCFRPEGGLSLRIADFGFRIWDCGLACPGDVSAEALAKAEAFGGAGRIPSPTVAIRNPQFTHDPPARRSTPRRIHAVPGFVLAHPPVCDLCFWRHLTCPRQASCLPQEGGFSLRIGDWGLRIGSRRGGIRNSQSAIRNQGLS